MPLTKKEKAILKKHQEEYGKNKGTQVFYSGVYRKLHPKWRRK